jgi:hypothetical protein
VNLVTDQRLAELVAEFGQMCKVALEGPGEREAGIRPPIQHLITTFADNLGLYTDLYPEVHMTDLQVRPDYAIRVNRVISGYIEVKEPSVSINPAKFRGHNRKQWERLRDLPNLLYTNGHSWALFRNGEQFGETAYLTGDLATAGRRLIVQDAAFEQVLRDFLSWHPSPVRSVAQLVRSIAPLCRLLRHEVLDRMSREATGVRAGQAKEEQPFTMLAGEWRRLLFPTIDDHAFADAYAQTVTFALLLARSEGIDLEKLTLHEVGGKLGDTHSLMGRALQLLTDNIEQQFRVSVDLLIRVINAVDWPRIRSSNVDAYLHLYEHFLEEYDEALRKESGTYYTPHQVVTEMVRLVDEVLRTRLGRARGFGSPDVFTVDPAMGTGTFLHEIIKQVGDEVSEQDGPGVVPGVVEELAKRLVGFEMQMGPFAVAELRGSDMLQRYGAKLPPGGLRLYVTNTLDDPYNEVDLSSIFVQISRSRRQANQIKRDTPVTVVIGNPPYHERAEGRGGWVEGTDRKKRSILDDFRLEGNGKYENALKNLYVYFWRWATWKVFDAHKDNDDGVIAFITTAGYLRGPGFKGMREYLRRTCDEGWIIDASPEGMQPDVPTRIFPGVQQPLAIGIFVRRAGSDREQPATIRYAVLEGRREAKYAQLANLTLDSETWQPVRPDWHAPFTPASVSDWDNYPALDDLLPWTITGITPNRAWVYAPSPEILQKRWSHLISENSDGRPGLLKTSDTKSIYSKSSPLPGQLAKTRSLAEEVELHTSQIRISYRSFDRQWLILDDRVIDRPRRDLWQAKIHNTIFVTEPHTKAIASGPGITLTSLLPDVDHFKGSEGGRVLPTLHPGGMANVAPRLLAVLGDRLGSTVTVEDLVAYIAGVVAHRGFTPRFAEELVTPGIRVPLTADPALWREAVEVGRQVVWLHTYGEAFADPASERPQGNIRYPAGDPRRPLNTVAIPAEPLPATISHDEAGEKLHVGSGEFAPVPAEVWAYDVGGMQVVKKWFSYRKADPGGKVSSPLDKIHVERWPHEWTTELIELLTVLRRLVELEAQQADLLTRIVASEQLTVKELTAAGVLPVPAIARRPHRQPAPAEDTAQGSLFGDEAQS